MIGVGRKKKQGQKNQGGHRGIVFGRGPRPQPLEAAGKSALQTAKGKVNSQTAPGREATAEDLADELRMPESRFNALLKMARQPVSSDAPVGDDGDVRVADLIQDQSADDPSDVAGQALLKEKLRDAFKDLTDCCRISTGLACRHRIRHGDRHHHHHHHGDALREAWRCSR